jgi:hypothetical protein
VGCRTTLFLLQLQEALTFSKVLVIDHNSTIHAVAGVREARCLHSFVKKIHTHTHTHNHTQTHIQTYIRCFETALFIVAESQAIVTDNNDEHINSVERNTIAKSKKKKEKKLTKTKAFLNYLLPFQQLCTTHLINNTSTTHLNTLSTTERSCCVL